MSFFENTRKPIGLGGKVMVSLMNIGHNPVAKWGLQFLNLAPDANVLDCGCGGGANIKKLLKPGGTFFICNESNGDTDKDDKWTQIIDGLTIYRDAQLKQLLVCFRRTFVNGAQSRCLYSDDPCVFEGLNCTRTFHFFFGA